MSIDYKTTNKQIDEMIEKSFNPNGLFRTKTQMRKSFRGLRDILRSLEGAKKIRPEVWTTRVNI